MTLELEELACHDFLGGIQGAHCVLDQKSLGVLGRAIENDVDEVVARCPGVLKNLAQSPLVERSKGIAQPIECSAKRGTPGLIPARMATGIAATITSPALDAVDTAPRGILDKLDFVGGWEALQKLAIVGQFHLSTRFE